MFLEILKHRGKHREEFNINPSFAGDQEVGNNHPWALNSTEKINVLNLGRLECYQWITPVNVCVLGEAQK